jgi:hypothetical protein
MLMEKLNGRDTFNFIARLAKHSPVAVIQNCMVTHTPPPHTTSWYSATIVVGKHPEAGVLFHQMGHQTPSPRVLENQSSPVA